MFTDDSMRGPGLDDTMSSRPAPGGEGCKGFLGYETDPPPCPSLYGGEYNVLLMGHKSVVTTPSHTGASEVFRRSTECAYVPREGSTPQCDARTGWGGVRFLPLRQAGVPRRGEGVDKNSAHSCRNEVCDHSSASVKHGR